MFQNAAALKAQQDDVFFLNRFHYSDNTYMRYLLLCSGARAARARCRRTFRSILSSPFSAVRSVPLLRACGRFIPSIRL
jgi:hypothetical protein